MARSRLRIGELATHSGVSIDALRYYERRGLLPRAARSAGGFRLFTSDAIERIRFIKQAQEIGLSLDEIGSLLAISGGSECRRVRDLLQLKLAELDERIRQMRGFRHTLADRLADCEEELNARGESACCPVVGSKVIKERR